MSYAIMTIVYGIPLTEEIDELIRGECDCEGVDPQECPLHTDDPTAVGFDEQYSAGSHFMPGFCGVELDSFDECTDAIDVSTLKFMPTAEQVAEAEAKFAKLHERIRSIAKPVGVYIIPSSS